MIKIQREKKREIVNRKMRKRERKYLGRTRDRKEGRSRQKDGENRRKKER